MFHVGNDVFDLGNLPTCRVVVLWRVQSGQLDLLGLELELGAGNGSLELTGGFVAQLLVDLLGLLAFGGGTVSVAVFLRSSRD